jgi:hypothetical protein
MALAPSSSPLLIAGITRFAGKAIVRVMNHGFTGAHVGQPLRVSGVSDASYNGNSFTVVSVPDTNTITYAQPGLIDNHVELTGGAISIG